MSKNPGDVLTTKVLGTDLKPGQHAKVNGRLYLIKELGPPDGINDSRLGTFETTSGELVDFYVFGDSEYELRSSMPSRIRTVRVRAEDVALVLAPEKAESESVLAAAIHRLKAAVQ